MANVIPLCSSTKSVSEPVFRDDVQSIFLAYVWRLAAVCHTIVFACYEVEK